MQILDFRPDMDHYRPWVAAKGVLFRVSDMGLPLSTPVADRWTPLKGRVRRLPGLKTGDFPNWLDPVFSSRARDALSDLLDPCGEWLPLQTPGKIEYFIYNFTNVVDVLDQSRSRVERFPDGTIWAVRRHVFVPEAVQACGPAFRVPEDVTISFFLTDAVEARIHEAGLQGSDNEEIWDSETGGVERDII